MERLQRQPGAIFRNKTNICETPPASPLLDAFLEVGRHATEIVEQSIHIRDADSGEVIETDQIIDEIPVVKPEPDIISRISRQDEPVDH